MNIQSAKLKTAEPKVGTVHPVILSGGSGTRLWPLSRALYPKQLQPLVGERTMLQDTALRLAGQPGVSAPIVICNSEHRFAIAEQLRDLAVEAQAIVLEPVGRNTAPAVAAAALLLANEPDALMIVLPADHVIADSEAFRAAVARAAPLANAGKLVTFGIKPNQAHTGYGYIQRGKALNGRGAYTVDSFKEKPNAATAKRYLEAGAYLWNSGIFVFRADRFLAELERLQPEIVAACRDALAEAKTDLDFLRLAPEAFARSPSLSIDYAVMEHTADAAVIPVDIGWNDVGAWNALWEIGARDKAGNVLQGDVLTRDVRNSYIRAEKTLVAALGVEDLLIVETGDVVLVAARERADEVRELVAELKRQGRVEEQSHSRHYRPWGYYETIDAGARFQVKHLCVKPGGQLSLQKHHHRAEHWVVVSGTAQVTRGEDVLLLGPNESIYIPMGTQHRLENPGKIPLDLVEVQSGDYLGEDDIVRLSDVYQRDPSETK